MKKIFLTFFTLFCVQGFSQNWEMFQANETYNFNQFQIHGVKIDSVMQTTGQTVFYFNRVLNDTVHQNSFGAAYPITDITQPNIFGSNCIVRNDSSIFKDQIGDFLYLLPQKNLNESWTFLSKGSDSIVATIDSLYQDSVNGTIDSLKVIRFQYYDSANTAQQHPVNNEVIVLSKNNGMIRMLNLYQILGSSIPFNYHMTYDRTFRDIDLTNIELFDYQVGDKIHLKIEDNAPLPPSPDYINLEIISRTTSTNGDTVYIVINEKIEENTAYLDNSVFPPIVTRSTSFTNRTFTKKVIYPNQSFNPKTSFEPTIEIDPSTSLNTASIHRYSLQLPYSSASNYNDRLAIYVDDFTAIFDTVQNSWMVNPFLKQISNYILEGVVEYSITSFNNGGGNIDIVPIILYFEKGTETWGNPRIVTGLEPSKNTSNETVIYPNPVKDQITIQSKNLFQFTNYQVIDINGRVVQQSRIKPSIQVNTIESGVYFLRLMSQEKVETVKFIKE